MKILNYLINIVNPPYEIEENPEIKIYNPKITIIDKGQQQFQISNKR